MAETTNIEWCDATFNPWIGCTKVSVASAGGGGCDNCYAEVSTPARVKRAAGVETWGPHAPRQRTSAHNWKQPIAWERDSAAFQAQHGRRRRVFCASLADVFDNAVPDAWRADLFELIRATPNLDWLLLTKRIGNVGNMLPVPFDFERIYPNVWLGATICNQVEADRDIPKLLALDATVRFLSIEPMLGPIDLSQVVVHIGALGPGEDGPADWDAIDLDSARITLDATQAGINRQRRLHWVICGGESGPLARPLHPDWARDLRDQCAGPGVPFLFKQWGEWIPADQSQAASQANGRAPIREFRMLDGHRMHLVGKKSAGRLLDGIEHNGFPEILR